MIDNTAHEALNVAHAAKSQIDSHEEICAERYKQILRNQEDAKDDRDKIEEKMSDGFKEIRSILVKASFAVLSALCGLVLLLGKYILSKGF